MWNLHIEIPSGARSRGYDIDNEETAKKWFSVVAEKAKSLNLTCDVVLTDADVEISREHIDASGQ